LKVIDQDKLFQDCMIIARMGIHFIDIEEVDDLRTPIFLYKSSQKEDSFFSHL